MSEITIHTGDMGDQNIIHISWFDEDNRPQSTELRVIIQNNDKPRTLEVRVNGVRVAEVPRNR